MFRLKLLTMLFSFTIPVPRLDTPKRTPDCANDALYIIIQRVAASSVELDDIVFLLPDNTEVYDA